jgi:hypothetical protein
MICLLGKIISSEGAFQATLARLPLVLNWRIKFIWLAWLG